MLANLPFPLNEKCGIIKIFIYMYLTRSSIGLEEKTLSLKIINQIKNTTHNEEWKKQANKSKRANFYIFDL